MQCLRTRSDLAEDLSSTSRRLRNQSWGVEYGIIYIYIYMYIIDYIYVYYRLYMCMYIIYIYICVCIYIYTHIYMYVCMYVCKIHAYLYIHKCELLRRPREEKGLSRNGWVYHNFDLHRKNEENVMGFGATSSPYGQINSGRAGVEAHKLQPGSRRCKRCHMMCLVVPLSKTWWGRL